MKSHGAAIAFTAALLIIAAVFMTIHLIVNKDRGLLDPRFDTCAEAQNHHYGPYRAGGDPEYGWYDDRNHDGVVCE